MQIHQLIDNEHEYRKFIDDLLIWTWERDLWKEEDRPKLEPYFKYDFRKGQPMTDVEYQSFEHYKKCKEEYAEVNGNKRDAVCKFHPYDIIEMFYCIPIIEEDDEDDEKPIGYIVPDDLSFPLIVTGAIECGFDRMGDFKYSCIRLVSLSEFHLPGCEA